MAGGMARISLRAAGARGAPLRSRGDTRCFALLICLLAALLVACAPGADSTPTGTTPTATADVGRLIGSPAPAHTSVTSLPIDCPHANQPVIQPGARITLTPDHGPAGTQVSVDISGIQAGCHLWLALTAEDIPPARIQSTPVPAPVGAAAGLQWLTIPTSGALRTSFCLCPPVYVYALGLPPYTTATPVAGAANVGTYEPKVGEFFFISVAGVGIPQPPPLYARFDITA